MVGISTKAILLQEYLNIYQSDEIFVENRGVNNYYPLSI